MINRLPKRHLATIIAQVIFWPNFVFAQIIWKYILIKFFEIPEKPEKKNVLF